VNKSGTGRTALVIVPTFNERENLPVLAAALMKYPEVSMLVVDDRSPDGTGALADGLARDYPGRIQVMHRTARPGLGRSYIDGIRSVLDRPVDVICQMDSDLSHDPQHLRDLIAASEHADVVIGSRYVPGGAIVNWPLRRKLLSRFANAYIRLVTRLTARGSCVAAAGSVRLERLFVPGGDVVRGIGGRTDVCRSADHVRRAAAGRIEAVPGRAGGIRDHAVAARGVAKSGQANRPLSPFHAMV
jgi:glycosyltransferase involved in cell wall biosynthesis